MSCCLKSLLGSNHHLRPQPKNVCHQERETVQTAVKTRQDEVLALLLREGPRDTIVIDAKCYLGSERTSTPLSEVAHKGLALLVRALLQVGELPGADNHHLKEKLLYTAARAGQTSVIRILFEHRNEREH